MSESLKRCPCCGGRAEIVPVAPFGWRNEAHCKSCGLRIEAWGYSPSDSERKCRLAWNRRAPQQSEQTDKPDQGGEDGHA